MNTRCAGFSLVEMMVAASILSTALLLGSKLILHSMETGKHTEDRYDLNKLRLQLASRVDCANLPRSCTKGSLVPIPGKNGKPLISSSGGTRFGDWVLRAPCTGNNAFQVKIAKVDKTGAFVKDPVIKQPFDFNHPQSTLFKENFLCGIEAPARPSPPRPGSNQMILTGPPCMRGSKDELPCNPAPTLPAACGKGYTDKGLFLDTFGGRGLGVSEVYGQRWLRHCDGS